MTTTRRRRPWRIAPAAAALALMLAACGSADSDDAADTEATAATAVDATAGEGSSASTTTAPSDGTTTAPAPTTGGDTAPAPTDAAAVPDILQFSAPLVGGGTFDGATVAGIPTAFWFWAPTWSICNREAPSVEEVAAQFAGQVNFVGVAWTGSDDDFQEFIDRHGLTFPQISDDPGDVFDRFEVAYQPALVIVNSDGSTELIPGAVDEALLQQIVAEAS